MDACVYGCVSAGPETFTIDSRRSRSGLDPRFRGGAVDILKMPGFFSDKL